MNELQFRNRQRERRVDTVLLRALLRALLEELLGFSSYEMAVHLVSSRKMAQINGQFLRHEGPTDVITFDLQHGYGPGAQTQGTDLSGEIYICVSVANKQSLDFGTSWQEEIARYAVHGVLHLMGHDDQAPAKRKVMKREENRLIRALGRRFNLARLGK